MPGEVAQIVRVIPLWKPQTVRDKRLSAIHTLTSGLVRGGWSRSVRQQSLSIIGGVTGHHEFLFCSELADLTVVPPVFMEIQASWCFYYRSALTARNTHVGHFVPWSRYPIDLGHNFVPADNGSRMIKRIQDQLSVGTCNKGCSAYCNNGPTLRRKP
jgi:hypothetical protein